MTKLPRVPLTADDVDKLLSVCGRGETGHRNRALLLLVHRSGLRISEALDLLPSDLDGNQIHVQHGKGDRSRFVTIKGYSTFQPILEKWLGVRKSRSLNGTQPLFCTLQGGRLDNGYVRALVGRLRKRAGIEKRVHCHGLRHGHAQELLQAGADLGTIANQLGHAHLTTTDRYVRASGLPARRFIESLD
jgi:site-specific recombinase XerD